MNNININEMQSAVNVYFEVEKAKELFLKFDAPIELEIILLDQMYRAFDKLNLNTAITGEENV
jgi:hypothetical protein